MKKFAVVYWSGTGNTEKMAEAVAEGIRNKEVEAFLYTADEFDENMVEEFAGFAFGCPSMGAEELEDEEFAPMFAACEKLLGDKPIILFGSYGWGDGAWMRTWQDHCREEGLSLLEDGYICNEEPGDEELASCRRLGEALVE